MFHQCPHCCSKSPCRGKTEPVLENLGRPRGQLQVYKNLQGRLYPPHPEPTNFGLVSAIKQVAYKLPSTKSSLFDPKRVPSPLLKQDCTHRNRQHLNFCLYKQGRRHEVGPTVCRAVENPGLVLQETGDSKGLTHSMPSQVFQLICTRWQHPQIDMFATRFNNKLPQCHQFQTPWHRQ